MAKRKVKEVEPTITTYKGFDSNLTCRGFQYEAGKEYVHEGNVKACSGGFHACEYPLDVFGYYPPSGSRFATVEQSGQLSRDGDDSKVASSKIKVSAEIGLPGLIKAAIEYTFSRAKADEGSSSTGAQGAASSTGDGGAAMSCGRDGKVMGKNGSAMFLVERDEEWKITAVWAGVSGRDGIKEGVWYTLRNGAPVEVEP